MAKRGLAEYDGRLIFAVCGRDIECWLLPLWADDDKAGKTMSCPGALNTALARRNAPTINPEAKKVPPSGNVPRGYRRPAMRRGDGAKRASLKVLLEELDRRGSAPPALE